MIKEEMHIDTVLKQAISSKQAWHYRIIPREQDDQTLVVIMDRGRQLNGINKELQVVLGKKVVIHPVEAAVIEESLVRHYPKSNFGVSSSNIPKLISNKENFILTLIEEAMSVGSSDIHFEVQEKSSRVRYRIDGNLVDKYMIAAADYPAVVGRTLT